MAKDRTRHARIREPKQESQAENAALLHGTHACYRQRRRVPCLRISIRQGYLQPSWEATKHPELLPMLRDEGRDGVWKIEALAEM